MSYVTTGLRYPWVRIRDRRCCSSSLDAAKDGHIAGLTLLKCVGLRTTPVLLTLDQAWWVGSRTRGRCCPVTLLSPDITEDPHCRVADARLISLYSKFLCWWGMEVRRVKCRLRCRPRHLTVVQNYEV
ncbi:hypothetical protein TNCV_4241381 [Trichonephila clavipes]|nr:hypothetical protein TNCV_4241381 [Trichonephila clavipes]